MTLAGGKPGDEANDSVCNWASGSERVGASPPSSLAGADFYIYIPPAMIPFGPHGPPRYAQM